MALKFAVIFILSVSMGVASPIANTNRTSGLPAGKAVAHGKLTIEIIDGLFPGEADPNSIHWKPDIYIIVKVNGEMVGETAEITESEHPEWHTKFPKTGL